MSLLVEFAKNTRGRDLVIADIHGCFRTLEAFLARLKFDPAVDRLFLNGDLGDRGRWSHEGVQWLDKPGVYVLSGNHEQWASGIAHGRHSVGNYSEHGGDWFLTLPQHVQLAVADAYDMLPWAFEIDTDSGKVGLVHAEAPDSWDTVRAMLLYPEKYSILQIKSLFHTLMWSRDRFEKGNTDPVLGIDRVYVGHTPIGRPVMLGNTRYIDGGAVYGRGLYCVQLGAEDQLFFMPTVCCDRGAWPERTLPKELSFVRTL